MRFRKFHERFAVGYAIPRQRVPVSLLSAVENKFRKITTEQRNPAATHCVQVIHNKVHALIVVRNDADHIRQFAAVVNQHDRRAVATVHLQHVQIRLGSKDHAVHLLLQHQVPAGQANLLIRNDKHGKSLPLGGVDDAFQNRPVKRVRDDGRLSAVDDKREIPRSLGNHGARNRVGPVAHARGGFQYGLQRFRL
ncbi:hypothetical protein SDC9_159718 [bioreactor metagenome]|uniref:Uncharacterized protein n=1 Tax=bioreactor metagenome TaxID=1076179 RepID=A0A645FEK1_9ZZZZ